MNAYFPIPVLILGMLIYHVWLCYRKQAKGLFTGGEIELIGRPTWLMTRIK